MQMVCRFICISNRHWMSFINMTKCLTLRSRIGQGGDCWRWYWSWMHYLDVLTCFPWLDIASGCSVCEVTLVTRSDSCPVCFQSGQVFFLNLLRIDLSHCQERIVRIFIIQVLKLWLSYELCKRRYIIGI